MFLISHRSYTPVHMLIRSILQKGKLMKWRHSSLKKSTEVIHELTYKVVKMQSIVAGSVEIEVAEHIAEACSVLNFVDFSSESNNLQYVSRCSSPFYLDLPFLIKCTGVRVLRCFTFYFWWDQNNILLTRLEPWTFKLWSLCHIH